MSAAVPDILFTNDIYDNRKGRIIRSFFIGNDTDYLAKKTIHRKSMDKGIEIAYTESRKRGMKMQIEIKLDPSCREPRIIIYTNKVTEEVTWLMRRLSEQPEERIVGYRESYLELLTPPEIIRIYGEQQRVYAQTAVGIYTLRSRLYQLEAQLDSKQFVRISNSEIINLKKVKNMDLRFSGTICVNLEGGIQTYVSRRYVTKLKQVLGI